MRLLHCYEIVIEGKNAIVVGRSPILETPIALILLNANAVLTLCHSKTQGHAEMVNRADIVVGAVGKLRFIKRSWIKAGAIVNDAGFHLGGIGDIKLSGIVDKCAAYTPGLVAAVR